LTEEQTLFLEQSFQLFDKADSGKLSADEFRELVHFMRWKLEDECEKLAKFQPSGSK
jgi:Ca2+-binding EF-hand superfamily protein